MSEAVDVDKAITAEAAQSGPVLEQQRIQSIDILRGVAILGILLMNIQGFSMIGAAYMNPTSYGDLTGANFAVWLFSRLVADQKFMTIFSMLFGAGIVLMTSRREATGRSSVAFHYRRMGILLVFGLLHAYAIWSGDILYTYAMCGFLVFLCRRWTAPVLIVVGVLSLMVASGCELLFYFATPYMPAEELAELNLAMWAPNAEMIAQELAVYRGGWLSHVKPRAEAAFFMQTLYFLIWGLWRAGGLMLIGMALFKMGVFNAACRTRTYITMIVAGAILGSALTLTGDYLNFQVDWEMTNSFFGYSQFNYWGSVPMALAWVGVVMLFCKAGLLRFLARPLASVGQMALTNYLLQSIVCTTIFYGHGLGLFGRVERTGQLQIVVAVWLAQLALSQAWMARFRFGPFEWLWRSMTYAKWQPIRK